MMWQLAARIADWYLKRRRTNYFTQIQTLIDRDPRFTRVAVFRRGAEFQLVDLTDLDQLPTFQGDIR